MLHTNAQHHLVENLTTAQSDEAIRFKYPLVAAQCRSLFLVPSNVRVIHLGNLSVLQRGDRIPLRLLVKRRTGDGSRSIAN